MGSLDVETAFDSINHESSATAVASRGIHAELVSCLMRELTGLQASITIPSASPTDRFTLEHGGKQGGVETPDEFNILIEHILAPIVKSWTERGYGFKLDAGMLNLHHLIWADNIYILAASHVQFQTMCQELTMAIYSHKLKWKQSSMEYLAAGPQDEDTNMTRLDILNESPLHIRRVESMETLGTMLDVRGGAETNVEHRLLKGEACFWANGPIFTDSGGVANKFRAWARGPATSAIHGAGTWHLTQDLLSKIQRWEFAWLRKLLRLRRKKEEGQFEFNTRSARKIVEWYRDFDCKFMHHRILLEVFNNAWREGQLFLMVCSTSIM